MAHATVLFTGLLIAFAGDIPDKSRDLETYEALRAKAGKDAPAQVQLALWCESRGLNAERMKHLARATLSDPKNVTARGLLGLIAFGGRWESIDTIGARAKADEARSAKLAEYNGRRTKLAAKETNLRKIEEHYKETSRPEAALAVRAKHDHDLAQLHASLGMWCEQNGLQPEAIAHFTTAVHLDPARDSSWRHLGCVKRNGRWLTSEQAAVDDLEDREQRQSNRHWEPLLRKWKTWLGDPASSSHRAEAKKQLASVTDPRAIPSILKLFPMDGSESDQTRLLQLLSQIDDPRSSRAMADLAIATPLTFVRQETLDILQKRPRRDYAGQLVQMIHAKIKTRVTPVIGPGSSGSLVLDTPRIRMILTYDTPTVFLPAASFRGFAGYDANGLPVIAQGREIERGITQDKLQQIELRTAGMIADAQLKADVVAQQMAADLSAVEIANEQSQQQNAKVMPVLQIAAGAPSDLKDDENAWQIWWHDTLGYSYQPPQQVTLLQNASPSQLPPPYVSTCFIAGTPVRTLDGPRPIEAIQVGDQVLSQDAATGAIGFQSVVFLHHNPPGKTLRVSLANGESLVCSVYHRFWKANQGWAMARELHPGDTLRTLGSLVRVTKVEPDKVQPLFNLDISGPRTFFVGSSNLLVHDNTLPDHRLKPFDKLADLDHKP